MHDMQYKRKFTEVYGRHEGNKIRQFFAPGRICLLGEHLDYNGGVVLSAAIDRGITAVYRSTFNQILCISSLQESNEVVFDLNNPIRYQPEHAWGNYVLAIYNAFAERKHKLQGAEILFGSNLPVAAGLSSSAALMMLTAYVLNCYTEADYSELELAKICRDAENNFIGLQSGLMDPLSISAAKENTVIALDCSNNTYKYVPVDLENLTLLVFNTNTSRKLTSNAYNIRTKECSQALGIIRSKMDKNINWRDLEMDAIALLENKTLKKRARHILTEQQRVRHGLEALSSGDIHTFANLMTASHYSLKENFEVSSPELDFFVEKAIAIEGCKGAKLTGAGFGGCAIALVSKSALSNFTVEIEKEYFDRFGISGQIFPVTLSNGVNDFD